ncbi:hypothetical protein H5410_033931 [Solanum commersonii]|uniref:DUF674 domain-containing protein n=1 Tax=Solanum commersonii TaxID=4109 RepID=A0A9J5YQ12_SOLCO|nr:hypothetical protein H5410_033931 [Solanum commersonii]
MVGCLGNLYESLENLYIQPNQEKDILLKPKSAQGAASLYTCSSHRSYVAEDPRAICPSCYGSMSSQLNYVKPAAGNNVVASNGGLVKGVVTYMVLDDLVVKPMHVDVKDVGVLKEKVVTLGMDEMLKTSLQSKHVLTSVFMDSINE